MNIKVNNVSTLDKLKARIIEDKTNTAIRTDVHLNSIDEGNLEASKDRTTDYSKEKLDRAQSAKHKMRKELSKKFAIKKSKN